VNDAVEGQIYTVVLSGDGSHREWFVGEHMDPYDDAVGVCFASEYELHSGLQRIGKGYSMHSCTAVADEDVPDEVWVALAKWKLTQ
jgi:hypothetical protein